MKDSQDVYPAIIYYPDKEYPYFDIYCVVYGELGKDWMPNVLTHFYCWERWN